MTLLLRTITSYPKGKLSEELIYLLDKDCDPHKRISVFSELTELEKQNLIFRDTDGKWRGRFNFQHETGQEAGALEGELIEAVTGHFCELGQASTESEESDTSGALNLKQLLGYFKAAVRADARGALSAIPEAHGTKWQLISGGLPQFSGEAETQLIRLTLKLAHLPGTFRQALLRREGDVPLGLKNPKYRLLVVANKFQTGFDEPLVQSMYVDKKLGGVQCVQTLSRLNRTTSGKTHTFVLDFANEPDEIRDSFQRFYQSTILDGETDPNTLYDTKQEIYGYNLYTHEEVNRFCEIFYNPNRDEGELHPILDTVVDRFKQIGEEEEREDFRSKIQSYIRMYGYLSQIINFKDIELEKTFVFLKYVNKKLPKRETNTFDITDIIDLDSLRIQKMHEKITELEEEDTIVTPPDFGGGGAEEPVYDLLSEIISLVNNQYGINLTEDDKVNIDRVRQKLQEDAELEMYMTGSNSEENKRSHFQQTYNDKILEFVNERFEFYKKLDDNPEIKKTIMSMLYKEYNSVDRSIHR